MCDKLRPVHKMPAVEGLPVEKAHEALLRSAEVFDSDIAVLVESVLALQAQITARQLVHARGNADDLAVQTDFNARLDERDLVFIPFPDGLERLLCQFDVQIVGGAEDHAHARGVLALHLVLPAGPIVSFHVGSQEDAAVLIGLHEPKFQAENEIAVLLVAAEPATTAVELEDAVLCDKLRPVHKMPAVEGLPVEKAHEALFCLPGGPRDI